MRPLIIIFAVLLLSVSCNNKHEQKDKIDYVIFGSYAGECIRHCATMFKLENNRLLIDRTDSFFKNREEGPTFNNDTLNRSQFKEAQFAIDSLPGILLTSYGATFGHPDDRDQGGLFVQIKKGDAIKTFYIDNDLSKVPKSLWKYVGLIRHFEQLNG